MAELDELLDEDEDDPIEEEELLEEDELPDDEEEPELEDPDEDELPDEDEEPEPDGREEEEELMTGEADLERGTKGRTETATAFLNYRISSASFPTLRVNENPRISRLWRCCHRYPTQNRGLFEFRLAKLRRFLVPPV